MEDPDLFLTALGLELPSAIDASRKAVLDAAHRSFVNHEVYFFADTDEKSRFDADPTRYCGAITDPVTRRRFRPSKDSPRYDYDGRVYFFPNIDSLDTFRQSPDMYARPMREMLPAPGPEPGVARS